jgi:hypothetical protein
LNLKSPRYKIKVSSSINKALSNNQADILIVLRFSESILKENIKQFKQLYKEVVIYDEHDSSAFRYLDLINEVDFYLKKLALKDFKEYLNYFPKIRLHRLFYLGDKASHPENTIPIDVNKLISIWDLSLGTYPVLFAFSRMSYLFMKSGFKKLGFSIGKLISKLALIYFFRKVSRKSIDVFAVFSQHSNEEVNFQRSWLADKYKDDSRFFMKKTNQFNYLRKINLSKITVSPFGYGEICFRDYEAIFARSLLFKPNMERFDVSDQIFIPFETYIPFKWDMSDFEELLEYYLKNEAEVLRITNNALRVVEEYRSKADDHALKILDKISEGILK